MDSVRSDAPMPRQVLEKMALGCWNDGAGEGIRTLDPNLGKVVLYP
jgi:hypothetical protein